MYCTAMYYTVMYCTAMYCTVLRYTVLRCIQEKNRAWSSPSLLPSPPLPSVTFFTSYCTVLYCTILYYTVLYCTILYSQSPVSFPVSKIFTCFETLTGGTRMNADILFSLIRGSLATLSTSLRSVVTQCRLHKKMKKTAGTAGNCTHSQMTSTVARSGHDPFLILLVLLLLLLFILLLLLWIKIDNYRCCWACGLN